MDYHDIKILHWNANVISNISHAKQFEYLLERQNIIASVNETHLKANHRIAFKNYLIYRNDRDYLRGGGVALFVRRSIKHKLLPVSPIHLIENIYGNMNK